MSKINFGGFDFSSFSTRYVFFQGVNDPKPCTWDDACRIRANDYAPNKFALDEDTAGRVLLIRKKTKFEDLTPLEFRVLKLILMNIGRSIDVRTLYKLAWQDETHYDIFKIKRDLHKQLSALRKKITYLKKRIKVRGDRIQVSETILGCALLLSSSLP